MGDEAIEHAVARIEDKDAVGAAVAVGLATTPRDIGAWYMTKDQVLQTLRSDNKTTPVYRDLFIERFMDKLPGWLWPSVAQHGLPLDEKSKRELVDAFRAELEHLTQENKIRNNQRRAIPVPGQTPSAGHH
jgi:hypothetical protein